MLKIKYLEDKYLSFLTFTAVWFAQGLSYKSFCLYFLLVPIFIWKKKSEITEVISTYKKYYLLILGFLSYVALSLIWSPDKILGTKVLISYCLGFICLLVAHVFFLEDKKNMRWLLVLIFIEVIWGLFEISFGVKWPLSSYSMNCTLFTKGCMNYAELNESRKTFWLTVPSGFRFNTNNFVGIVLVATSAMIPFNKWWQNLLIGFVVTAFVIQATAQLAGIALVVIALFMFFRWFRQALFFSSGVILAIFLFWNLNDVSRFKIEGMQQLGTHLTRMAGVSGTEQIVSPSSSTEIHKGLHKKVNSKVLRSHGIKYYFKVFLWKPVSLYGLGVGQSFYLYYGNLHNYLLEIMYEFGFIGGVFFYSFLTWLAFILLKKEFLGRLIIPVSVLCATSISTLYYFMPMYVGLACILTLANPNTEVARD